MRNALSATFWTGVLAILWMVAGHAWAGAMLAIVVAVFAVLAIAAIIDLIG